MTNWQETMSGTRDVQHGLQVLGNRVSALANAAQRLADHVDRGEFDGAMTLRVADVREAVAALFDR